MSQAQPLPAAKGKGDSPKRRAKPPAPRRGRRTLITFALGLAVGYGLGGPIPHLLGPALAGLWQSTRTISSKIGSPNLEQGRILVLGTDAVSDNTDVMMTVQIKDGRTEITQVPRDTFIESADYGVLKANALYATGGVGAVKREISTLLGEPVGRHLIVNLNAVQHLAEALGGVEIDVPKRLYYVDQSQGLTIDLEAGPQLLQGDALEGFLRFRHDEAGDLGRMERQRMVLKEVFRKLAQPATLARLPELLRIAGEDVKTDLSPLELTALMASMGTTKLSSSRLAGQHYWQNDLSYWMPDLNPNHAAYMSTSQQL